MLSPSNEERICAMFDSFCKTVSHNFVRNLDRAEAIGTKHFVTKFLKELSTAVAV